MTMRVPSVLWCCWLSSRKSIQPEKKRVVECWCGYLSEARCRLAYCHWCHCHSLSLASVKSRLVLPFWYWLIQVVRDKGPLNRLVYVMRRWVTEKGRKIFIFRYLNGMLWCIPRWFLQFICLHLHPLLSLVQECIAFMVFVWDVEICSIYAKLWHVQ